jgi:bla regulator protein blaR1
MNPLTHVLESTLFAGAVRLATLALRRNRARTRHALWMAASMKFLVPFALLVSLGSHAARRDSASVPPPQMRFVLADAVPPRPLSAVAHLARSEHRDWLPSISWAVWLGGCIAILARWYMRWRRADLQLRGSKPWSGWQPAAPMVSSASLAEPGVFGIFHQVLVLPAGIEQHLSAEQLRAVIAHEACHMRHRDNLSAAIHMLVEALFWFHPLVWWIGARLVEERERACDEEVLQLGSDPVVYAESILRVCQFCLAPPVPCVSGITGAELKDRIRDILAGRAGYGLGPGKKLLLATMGIAAVVVPLAIGLAQPFQMRAQTAAPLRFDVASVKVSSQQFLVIRPDRSGGRIRWTTDLGYVLGYAYRLQPWRISGPVPGSTSIYDFDVVTGADATDDQVRLMFQSLLADRFKMTVHRVTKDVEGFALTVGKGVPKMQEAKDSELPPLPEWIHAGPDDKAKMEGHVVSISTGPGIGNLAGRRVSMLQLSEALQRVLQVAVLDETGLTGSYYFGIQYATDTATPDVTLPDLFSAVKALGLKLEKHKGPVEMLVVDHIEKTPTEN